MHTSHTLLSLTGACLIGLALGQPAWADVQININKSTQRMTVTVDGQPRYNWPISTGRPSYDTPNGTFRAFRMEKDHRSEEWDNAPMPYSIFFTRTGVAVHGTYEQRSLGRAVSHGCVRLSVANAAVLWDLVKRESLNNTTVRVSGSVGGANATVVARPGSMPPAAIGPRDSNSKKRPLFPFFAFGR